jgi:glycosyltransferase involved in cell wall biosynthesis
MRVALESTVLELDAGGVSRALRGLRSALAERDDVELVDLAHPPRPLGRALRGLDRETRWFWLGLPRAVRRAGAELLHLPAAVGPWRSPVPLVVTVHDLLAIEHPEWFSRANGLQQRLAVRRLARAARRVIVPSRHTAERLAAVTSVDDDRVRVIPWGVGPPFAPGEADPEILRRHGIDDQYVLAVGTLQPRKGFDELAEAVGDRLLVIVGARGWRDDDVVARLRGRAVLAGQLSDSELVALMRGAEALVHPARAEGFGFPPLEAMACGTPVVAYRSSSLPEVVGEAGLLAEPAPRALGEALARLLADRALRSELSARGTTRAAKLTWERCADATAAVYREALAG